jgi:predicted ATP-grasp superfamily ATP-dependent carboligase
MSKSLRVAFVNRNDRLPGIDDQPLTAFRIDKAQKSITTAISAQCLPQRMQVQVNF